MKISLTRRQRTALLVFSAGAYAAWLAGVGEPRTARLRHVTVLRTTTR